MTERLGILARWNDNRLRPFGAQSSFFMELASIATEFGVTILVFDPRQMNLGRQDQYGFRLDADGPSCERTLGALPDAIYDRYLTPSGPSPDIEQLRASLAASNDVFNSPDVARLAGDKLRSAEVVANIGVAVPPLSPISDRDRVSSLTRSHSLVVVKPRTGMKGAGVRFVEEVDDDLNRAPRLDYIVQAFVPSLSDLGGDIRALMQREDSTMTCVAAYQRGAPIGKPASLSLGSDVVSIEHYLERLGYASHQVHNFRQRVTETALAVAAAIEAEAGPAFELGLDFIHGDDGQLWFIEANSKPGRFGLSLLAKAQELSPRERRSYEGLRRRSLENIIRYGLKKRSESGRTHKRLGEDER